MINSDGLDDGQDFWTRNAPSVDLTNTRQGDTGFDPSTITPTTTSSSTDAAGDANAFGAAWQASGGRTVADLRAFIAAHPGYGATLSGSKGDKVTIGGRTFDAVISAGTGGNGAWWNDITNGGGGGGASGPLATAQVPDGFAPVPYQSQPYGGPAYQTPQLPSWLQGPYVPPQWQGGDFQAPALPTELQTPFHAPTQAELEASPGYQTRLSAGLLAGDRSAAARGTLLGGGQQKALARYGQDYAANEFGNLYGQNLTTRGQQVGEYNTQYGNAFDSYKQRYQQFTDSAGMDFSARTANANAYQQDVTNSQNQYQANYGQYLNDQQRQLSQYTTNAAGTRNAQLDYWSRLMNLTSNDLDANRILSGLTP